MGPIYRTWSAENSKHEPGIGCKRQPTPPLTALFASYRSSHSGTGLDAEAAAHIIGCRRYGRSHGAFPHPLSTRHASSRHVSINLIEMLLIDAKRCIPRAAQLLYINNCDAKFFIRICFILENVLSIYAFMRLVRSVHMLLVQN